LLVNCRKAYWCPAAPDPRSACTSRAAAWQPAVPVAVGLGRDGVGVGVAGRLDGVARADELEAGCDELTDTGTLELGALGRSVAVLEAGGAEATGVAELMADEHPALNTTVAPSTSTSRRGRNLGVPGWVRVPVRGVLTIMRWTLID
jgi:hypothetical protein